MDTKKLLIEFNSLSCDSEKWEWVIRNQQTGITIMLDNDDTFGVIENKNGEDDYIFQFDEYIGWSDGIFELLTAFGIKHESV
jgi:hypothetical protein